MNMSDKGLVQLAGLEGIVLAPYRDSVGVPTVYVGHTKAAGGRDPAMMDPTMPKDTGAALREAIAVFRQDIKKYEAGVLRAVKVPMTQPMFDALVSFHYNTGGIKRATLTKKLNAGDISGAAKSFMGWLKPPEIKGRREKEKRLFENGQYSGEAIPVYGTNGKLKLGKVIRRITPREMLDLLNGSDEVEKANWLAALIAAILKMIGVNK